MRASGKLAGVLSALALTAAACGTTVPASEVSRAESGTSGLADGTGTTGLVSTPENGSDPGATTGSAVTSGSSGTTGGGAGAGSGGTTGAGSATGPVQPTNVASGRPSAGAIKIGALTANGAAQYQKSLGFSGATGDQTAMTKSVVSWINAHGGYGGRKVELLTYDLDTGAFAANPAAAMQAACTFFTQDNKVAALASYVALVPESFYACLAKAHVPVVSPDEGVSKDFFQRYADSLYMPAAPSYTRLLADSVDALWSAGWLTAGSRVGVVGYDTNDVHAIVDKGLVPALQRHGLKLLTGLYTAASTSAASEYNGGVLKFSSQRIDRVFFAPGGEPIYFALAAESQGYHPRYELGSLEYPTTLAANLPADQLSGSMGLGWLPYLDLPSTAWASVPTPGIADCRKAMASADQDFSSGTTLGIAAWICDEWTFLRDVFNAGASPNEASIRRVAESLGDRFRPAATFLTTYAPGRTHDGASAYRLLAFQDPCGCYKYVSPQRPLS
jgi:ABC-type branched-subunit amino acid transport system substrate-binding protein